MPSLIPVIIVDDHPLMRVGMTQLLALNPKLEVIAQAANGNDAVKVVKDLQPHLVLLDLNMKGISGLQTLKLIRQQGYQGKVIVVTVSDNKQDLIATINQGANGYLLKDTEPERLLDSINQVLSGKLVVTEQLTPFLQELDQEDNIRSKLASLTKRELQILQEIAKGRSNRDISEIAHISEGTVKVHVKSLLKKLEMKSRVEAAVLYLQQPK